MTGTNQTVISINRDGYKEVLGMWLGKNESASFWMGILTDLKSRGVEDMLITATDNLNGFSATIRSVFPECSTQVCVVHQIRNACRYVVWKDKKTFTADMKPILALREISRRWTMPIRNWAIILNQFLTLFENRVQL